MIQVQRILVPLDFSRHADFVLEWAAHLAKEHGSRLLLLHAYHLPVEFQQLEGAYLPQDFWASVRPRRSRTSGATRSRCAHRVSRADVIVREGYPATVIEQEAIDQHADLIVIGTRGLSGLKHLLLGSIAERVVQKAPCPVLTVKTRESRAARPSAPVYSTKAPGMVTWARAASKPTSSSTRTMVSGGTALSTVSQ